MAESLACFALRIQSELEKRHCIHQIHFLQLTRLLHQHCKGATRHKNEIVWWNRLSQLTLVEHQPFIRARSNDHWYILAPCGLGKQFRIFRQKALFGLVRLDNDSQRKENVLRPILSRSKQLAMEHIAGERITHICCDEILLCFGNVRRAGVLENGQTCLVPTLSVPSELSTQSLCPIFHWRFGER